MQGLSKSTGIFLHQAAVLLKNKQNGILQQLNSPCLNWMYGIDHLLS